MSGIIIALLAVLAQIAPSLGVPASITAIITALEAMLPTIIKEIQDVVPLVKNIIGALKDNNEITQEQLDALDALEAKLDAEFEAAVAQPDDEGMPG